jgi:SET domain-containing protein
MNGQNNDNTADERGALDVRSIEGMGWGVFARTSIAAGAIVIRNCTIAVAHAEREHAEKTIFNDYYFVAEEPADHEPMAYLALGLGSLINHSGKSPNVEPVWEMTELCWIVEFTALGDIKAGEQLFFDYGFEENEIPQWEDNHVAR